MATKLPKEVKRMVDEITQSEYETVKKSRNILLGTMLLYYYPTPKYAATLPVYDQLPFVFMLGGNSKYIWGLNIHYFSWAQRLQFMKFLGKKPKLKYSDVRDAFNAGKIPLGMAKYCYRLYLKSHIKSTIRIFDLLEDEEFDDAYNLAKDVAPIFKKKTDAAVFKDIRSKFKKHKQQLKKGKP